MEGLKAGLFPNMLGKEGWRYTETGLYEHEGVKNISPKDFITKCNDKEILAKLQYFSTTYYVKF